jgi:hypothetical protein
MTAAVMAARGVRPDPRGRPGRPLAVLQGRERALLRRQPARLEGLGFKGVYDCIEAFSEADFTGDLKRFEVPTLIRSTPICWHS